MIVISDTSPISNLVIIGQVEILHQLFEKVIIPPAVYQELLELQAYGYPLQATLIPPAFEIHTPNNQAVVKRLREELDAGESEAIALALEMGIPTLLIDERKGYTAAEAEGLQPVGLLGTLVIAKQKGLVPEVSPLMDRLQNEAGFYIGQAVYRKVQALANETS